MQNGILMVLNKRLNVINQTSYLDDIFFKNIMNQMSLLTIILYVLIKGYRTKHLKN